MSNDKKPCEKLPSGIYVPTPTFFNDNEDLDLITLEKHVKYLCDSSVTGIVFLGSTGEAVHLNEEERISVIKAGVKLMKKSYPSLKIIAGCSGQSVHHTLKLINDAAQNGVQYALVLPPSYYHNWIDSNALKTFYTMIANQSSIPIIIYNYPGVTHQTEIDLDVIINLSYHPNIVGIKSSDENIEKMTYLGKHINKEKFTLMNGTIDSFYRCLKIGSQGCITSFGNVAPRICIHLLKLWQDGKIDEAYDIQNKLITADNALYDWYGISGLKSALQHLYGYGGRTRSPLQSTTDEQCKKILDSLEPALEIERKLTT